MSYGPGVIVRWPSGPWPSEAWPSDLWPSEFVDQEARRDCRPVAIPACRFVEIIAAKNLPRCDEPGDPGRHESSHGHALLRGSRVADLASGIGPSGDCAILVKKRFPSNQRDRRQPTRRRAAGAIRGARAGGSEPRPFATFRVEFTNHVAMAPQRGHPPFIKIIAIKDGTRLGADDTSRVGFRARPVALF